MALTATAADGAVTIAVSDTGIGIMPEDQAAILRGVSPGYARMPEAGGHGTRADAGQEVRGAARRADLGPESRGPGVDVHLHPAPWSCRQESQRSERSRAPTAMTCPRCQARNPEDARFCEECGARLTLACPQCGAEISPGKKFCRACGTALSGGSIARVRPATPSSTSPRRSSPPRARSRGSGR